MSDREKDDEALDLEKSISGIMDELLDEADFPDNDFDVKFVKEVDGAYSTLCDRKRSIMFDIGYFFKIEDVDAEDDDDFDIGDFFRVAFAHEIGHHILGHTLAQSNNWNAELAADYFAGSLLYSVDNFYGISKFDMYFKYFQDENGGDHPKLSLRLNSFARGWYKKQFKNGSVLDHIISNDCYRSSSFSEFTSCAQKILESANFENSGEDEFVRSQILDEEFDFISNLVKKGKLAERNKISEMYKFLYDSRYFVREPEMLLDMALFSNMSSVTKRQGKKLFKEFNELLLALDRYPGMGFKTNQVELQRLKQLQETHRGEFDL